MNYDVSGRFAGETLEDFQARRFAEVEEEVKLEKQRDARMRLGIMDNQFVDLRALKARGVNLDELGLGKGSKDV